MFDDLIARLAVAEEGRRELDARIEAAISGWPPDTTFEFGEGHTFRVRRGGGRGTDEARGHYTTSLDAALTLLPAECTWSLSKWRGDGPPVYWADVHCPKESFCARKAEATLALCIAALRAIQAQKERDAI